MIITLALLLAAEQGPWTRVTSKKDEKGIEALYKQMDEIEKKHDLNAMAELYDFPIYMATDNDAGSYEGSEWSKEKFIAEMKPMFDQPPPKDMKKSMSRKVFFNSETVATVIEEHTMSVGKNTSKWTSTCTVVMKNGKWLYKSYFEAGWGGPAKK